MWTFTVPSPRSRSRAIALLDFPCTRSASTPRWRGVSVASADFGAGGRLAVARLLLRRQVGDRGGDVDHAIDDELQGMGEFCHAEPLRHVAVHARLERRQDVLPVLRARHHRHPQSFEAVPHGPEIGRAFHAGHRKIEQRQRNIASSRQLLDGFVERCRLDHFRELQLARQNRRERHAEEFVVIRDQGDLLPRFHCSLAPRSKMPRSGQLPRYPRSDRKATGARLGRNACLGRLV